jgi:F0F1-type ATP synthase assembly protein I
VSGELSKEIVAELKKMNEKLDRLNEPRGLSTPMKMIALFLGAMVVGPLIAVLLSSLLSS